MRVGELFNELEGRAKTTDLEQIKKAAEPEVLSQGKASVTAVGQDLGFSREGIDFSPRESVDRKNGMLSTKRRTRGRKPGVLL